MVAENAVVEAGMTLLGFVYERVAFGAYDKAPVACMRRYDPCTHVLDVMKDSYSECHHSQHLCGYFVFRESM